VRFHSLTFRKLPGDRPALGIIFGGAFVLLASGFRWLLGGMSEGFGPMTFLPAILLAGLFGGRAEGSISIDISTGGAQATLRYGDDGPGLSPDFGKSDHDSLGQGILRSLARQLHGTLTYERGAGAVTKLVFPAPASTRRGRTGRIGRLSV
jgi:hypothetical protein